MGKYSDAEFMTYYNHSRGIALDFRVRYYECFSSYHKLKAVNRIGACAASGGCLAWENPGVPGTVMLGGRYNVVIGSSRAQRS